MTFLQFGPAPACDQFPFKNTIMLTFQILQQQARIPGWTLKSQTVRIRHFSDSGFSSEALKRQWGYQRTVNLKKSFNCSYELLRTKNTNLLYYICNFSVWRVTIFVQTNFHCHGHVHVAEAFVCTESTTIMLKSIQKYRGLRVSVHNIVTFKPKAMFFIWVDCARQSRTFRI